MRHCYFIQTRCPPIIFNEKYPLIQGNKKGVWVPMLASVRWYNNKSITEFPLNIDFGHDFETLKAKLGEPTQKSSDISVSGYLPYCLFLTIKIFPG
jgi:hypothetical protein